MIPFYQDEYTTIYHGDSREILPTLADIDSVISDVPYGVDLDTNYKRFSGGESTSASHKAIKGDSSAFDPSHLMKYRRVVLFGANNFTLPAGTFLVWDKRTPHGNKNVMADAEIAWFNSGHGVYILNHAWDGFNRASEHGTKYHPAQKPVALMQWVIGIVKPKGTVCDPYMGSGSALIAARNLGYKAIGIELDLNYCQITVDRLLATPLPFPMFDETKKEDEKQLKMFD